MDFSPAFHDVHSIQNDNHPSPMSLPPRSVATKEEIYPTNMDTTLSRMAPPPSVSSYHPNSVAPSTPFSATAPFTPRPVDVSHLQPSLQ